MAFGESISIVALCATSVLCLLPSNTNPYLQKLKPTQNVDAVSYSTHLTLKRLFHVQQAGYSADTLEKIKNIITLTRRVISSGDLALLQYEKSVLYLASEQRQSQQETEQFVPKTYEQILSRTLSLTCSENNVLQTITNAIKIRGLVLGQETKATEITGQFRSTQLQLQSLQKFVSLVIHDRSQIQCETSTVHLAFQQYINYNIVQKTKQVIQRFKEYIAGVNQTFNACETVEFIRTFLSRCKILLPKNDFPVTTTDTPISFHETIRYKWNETEQKLCGVLSDVTTAKRWAEYENSGNLQTSHLDDVIMNIQNSLAALGNNDGCLQESKHLPLQRRTPRVHDFIQSAFANIDALLFELYSYNQSGFCSP